MYAEDLEVGRTYKVDASDCCVSVVFTSRLQEKIMDESDPNNPEWSPSLRALLFANGAKVDGHGVEYTEVPEVGDVT